MIEPRHHEFQVENHLIDDQYYWEWSRTARWREALEAADGDRGPLWSNDSPGYNGLHVRVAERATDPRLGSLRLIEVRDLNIQFSVGGTEFGNGSVKVRGSFTDSRGR